MYASEQKARAVVNATALSILLSDLEGLYIVKTIGKQTIVAPLRTTSLPKSGSFAAALQNLQLEICGRRTASWY